MSDSQELNTGHEIAPTSDADLLRQFCAGEMDAWETLLDRYLDTVVHFLEGMMDDQELANDVAVDAFTWLKANPNEYLENDGIPFKMYMYKVARERWKAR